MLRSKAATPAKRHRLGARVSTGLLAPDRYAVVFCLILVALILIGATGESIAARILVTAVLGVNVVYTAVVSRTPRRWVVIAALLVTLALFLASMAEIRGLPRMATLAEASLGAVLVLVTPAIIARRLIHHNAVTFHTLAGALSIYLLLGIFFAYVYRILYAASPARLFVQTVHPRVVDFLYFSYVTLTTLGYGDLTPASGVPRMLAVTEALLGQFYLVTVVALLVSHVTIERRQRGDVP